MSSTYNVAVVGATGAVGEAMIEILEQREFPVNNLYPLASARSAGSKVMFKGKPHKVELLEDFDFSKTQIALFSAGARVAEIYAPKAGASGCVVIDNSSQFRYDDDIPLVVPEVNPKATADYKARNIIANPNCSTIQMLVALKPIYDAVGIERINVCTYQAVSGTGKEAMEELAAQSVALMSGQSVEAKVYPHTIAFNVLPQCDVFMDNGYTREEMKMLWETRKIFADESIQVNPTAARVPVFYGHSEAVHIETRDKITAKQARELLSVAPGIEVVDNPETGEFATPTTHAVGKDPVYISRIREDMSHPRGLNMWVVSDNVRKGAALNSVQIGEILVKHYL